jgi:hypothetical protein
LVRTLHEARPSAKTMAKTTNVPLELIIRIRRETNGALSGNELTYLRQLERCVRGVPAIRGARQVGHAKGEPLIPWWLDVKGVGESLRERYQVPEELPPKLLKLINKLDEIEGNQLLRYSGTVPDNGAIARSPNGRGHKGLPRLVRAHLSTGDCRSSSFSYLPHSGQPSVPRETTHVSSLG